MRIFVTGATGFIGSAVTRELIDAGHEVVGLARSEAGAAALRTAGAKPLLGSIEQSDMLQRAADAADGVIHLAFNHDFTRYVQNCEDDRRVIATLGQALAGSRRPLIVTSGAGLIPCSVEKPATEEDPAPDSSVVPRAASEEAARAAADDGVNASIVRLAQIHDASRQGLISFVIALAREKGVAAYVDRGDQRWAAAPVADTAQLFRLALEQAEPRAVYHAVTEEGVALREITEAYARRLALPTTSIPASEAQAHFGWLAHFVQQDMIASSRMTRTRLSWAPTGPRLLENLARLEV
ncbi:SDR family oxidoreductase [Salinicola rhizosphaerae]|uniref:NAD-dependent dehydratase n=1 Tax=Salinicola rhizosphaerae TaxID=1443141 RepID=A0ABQ3E0M9_9GAMM|nr:SDR family oxidoreductase [Salinicola rhizosphaerae]GHB21058.1 NAD-dependent dehydratase [Salinicola rhizosphaerae]